VSLSVQMIGAAELVAALKELPKRATQKAVVRRALLKAAEPTRSLASALAPDDPETPPIDLHTSIAEETKTSARQGDPFAMPGDVIVYVGPVSSLKRYAHGVVMELGSFKDRPQPFMRPAWEATKEQDLSLLGYWMWTEIDGTARRLGARAARLGG
jgi:HK97 gp10 family phage protein